MFGSDFLATKGHKALKENADSAVMNLVFPCALCDPSWQNFDWFLHAFAVEDAERAEVDPKEFGLLLCDLCVLCGKKSSSQTCG
jgi:hypothetical protein